jgi:hypothetical protein
MAWRGEARRGPAWRGTVLRWNRFFHRAAWHGQARRGMARHGMARHGMVSICVQWTGSRERGMLPPGADPATNNRGPLMKMYTFRITGIRPLLMNNGAAMIAEPGRSPTDDSGLNSGKPVYDNVALAEAATYRTVEGQLCLLSIAFRAAILGPGGSASGRSVKPLDAQGKPSKGKGRSAGQVFSGAVFLVEDRCPLFHPQTKAPLLDYEIDVRRAVVNKAGIPRARPIIRAWACDLRLEIDEQMIPASVVLELLQLAGRISGVGDYRPQKKGPFGLFAAELLGGAA